MSILSSSQPWPIELIKKRLSHNSTLFELIKSRRTSSRHDIREQEFEKIVQGVLAQKFGDANVIMRKQIKTTLKLQSNDFPGRTQPDVVFHYNNQIHICELKSNRVDYARFDDVFDSRPFKQYLYALGHKGHSPWEVEQDLIKLYLYKDLSPLVGSCLFLMIDGYKGTGRSWTEVFENKGRFVETMCTELIRSRADHICHVTHIENIITPEASARLIICPIHNMNT